MNSTSQVFRNRLTRPIRRQTPPLGVLALAAATACSAARVEPGDAGGSPAGTSNTASGNPLSPDAGASGPHTPHFDPQAGDAGGGDDTPQAPGASADSADAGTGEVPTNDDVPPAVTDPEVPTVDSSDPEPPVVPTRLGGLDIDSTVDAQALDLFGAAGHKIWIEVASAQVDRMNTAMASEWNDRYTPGVGPTFVDHLVVQDANTLSVANYGKMETWLLGSSSKRPWTTTTIPNVRIDSNEFQKGLRIGSFEHIRMNNGVVGGIFREYLSHRIYRALGYPAARGTHAFLGSSVWGEDIWVPMTLMEVYKRRFCKDNAELIGGGETCPNMWEFPGDLANGMEGLPTDACQVGECDNTRLAQTMDMVASTPAAAGFKQALDPYISWSHFHQFQCLSWMLWTGDDALHNLNNNLIIEREDGRLVWAPYSVDISLGQAWHQKTPLPGRSAVAQGCQGDPQCWADTVATCGTLIEQFDELNPETLLDETVNELTALNMLRTGDVEDAAAIREWLLNRQTSLVSELNHYRYLQDAQGNCAPGLSACTDGTCSAVCIPLPN